MRFFNDLFDVNNDGKLDSMESALDAHAYMVASGKIKDDDFFESLTGLKYEDVYEDKEESDFF